MAELYNGIAQGLVTVEGNYTEDLFLQVGENTFETWDVAVNQVIKVGTALGLDEATNKLVVCDDGLGATSGSEPYGVATHAYDTSATGINKAGSMAVLVRTTGKLNANVIKFAGTYTIDKIRPKLSKRGISIDTPYYSA